MRRSAMLAAFAFASLLLAPAGVSAQGYWFFPPTSTDAGTYMCHKDCPADYAPCDPHYFKQADRRCQMEPHNGGHHHHH